MTPPKSLSLMLVVVLTLALSNFAPRAWSQEVTATIVGAITDPSGAAIKGAEIVATDTDRGTVWRATSNEAGEYNLLRLPIGTYTLKASASSRSRTRPSRWCSTRRHASTCN